jgi:hypothetical protein
MSDKVPDLSMLSWNFLRRDMASREIALRLAELVIGEIYGEADLRTQRPLSIEDGVDVWRITGSRDWEKYPPDPGGIVAGPVSIHIIKRDCRIAHLSEAAYLVPENGQLDKK